MNELAVMPRLDPVWRVVITRNGEYAAFDRHDAGPIYWVDDVNDAFVLSFDSLPDARRCAIRNGLYRVVFEACFYPNRCTINGEYRP